MPTQPAEEELLTPREVAALLMVNPRTVTRWAVAGRLTAIRTPSGHRRYLKSDVLTIMSGLHPTQVAPAPSARQERSPEPCGATSPILVPAQRDGGPRSPCRPTPDERQAAAAAVVAAAVAVALEVAAGAAEEVLARDAVRTTTRLRVRADVAAAQVEHAAAQAARALLHSIEGGTVLDASEFARLLAAAVLAAAETAAQEPRRAAATVANAVAAAASHVARAVGVAEARLEDHDRAAAHALNHEAEPTADQVARRIDARATSADMAAREAATEVVLGKSPSCGDEPARNQREQRIRVILSKAEARDKQADRRDSAADHRDSEASLAWLLGDDDLGFSLQARRAAAMDRSCSKDDRSLAASDRSEMAELEP